MHETSEMESSNSQMSCRQPTLAPIFCLHLDFVLYLSCVRKVESRAHEDSTTVALPSAHVSAGLVEWEHCIGLVQPLEQKMGAHASGKRSSAGLPLSMVWLLTQASRLCTVVFNTCAVTLVWYMLRGAVWGSTGLRLLSSLVFLQGQRNG